MRCFIFWAILPLLQSLEIINYTNEPYALVPMEQAYFYKENGTLFHIMNVTALRQKFFNYRNLKYDHSDLEDKKFKLLMDKCEEYLDQLTTYRNRRALNFLGTGIKFITGMPDHDDMVMVQQKLNDLIENNNRLSVINSKLQKNIEYLTGNSNEYHLDILFEWLASELSQIIYTINLAKMGVLNTAILDFDEVNQIIKTEKNFDAPLMEILEHATFKILQMGSIYVILIRYPIIEQKCMLYNIKPIEREMGKLQLEEFTTYCNYQYVTVRNCKKYVNTNICRYYEHTCTQELLNGIKTNCTLIREHMPSIEEVDNGKILIHGIHTVNNITKRGTYLIMFNNSILIDNRNYTNDKDLVLEYIRNNKPTQYKISKIIESQSEKLKIPTLTIIEKIPIEIDNHPIRSTIFLVVIFIIILITIHYSIKICKRYNEYKKRITQEEANTYVRALFQKEIGVDFI